MTIPSLRSAPAGVSLAATLFRDAATYDGELAMHPLTRGRRNSSLCSASQEYSGSVLYIPRWIVMLLEYGERTEKGTHGGEALRAHFDDREARVDTVTSVFTKSSRETPFWQLFCSNRHEDLPRRLAGMTRIDYPPRRYHRARTAGQEYTARGAQALRVYDPALHGDWPELEPEMLRRRILRLAVHRSCKRLVALQKGDGTLYRYLDAARTELPFLLNACALGLTAHEEKTSWLARRRRYLRRWNQILHSLTDAYVGDDLIGHVDASDDEDEGDLAKHVYRDVRVPTHQGSTDWSPHV
jgi:hypothetical protein